MLETIVLSIGSYIASLDPMKFGVMFFGIVFTFLMLRAHSVGKLDWTDLITARGSNKVSLTKFLQLVGGITGTWIMMYQTMHDKLTYDLFLIYLTYVGAIEAWSKFVSARYGASDAGGANGKPPGAVKAPDGNNI